MNVNKNFQDSPQLIFGNVSPDMSINSDLSLGTKKVLNYNSSSMKFFPKEELATNIEDLKINISEINLSSMGQIPSNEHTPNKSNSPSPKRSAIRNKGKAGTSYFFTGINSESNEPNEENHRTENKKKTIKFGDKDEVKFFTMKETFSKNEASDIIKSNKNSRISLSSRNHSSNSRKQSFMSNNNTVKEDEEKEAVNGNGTLFKSQKDGNVSFGKSITVIMIINHFLKQLKLKSGKFGRLGPKQFKILNDLGYNEGNGKDLDEEFEPNLMARMIKKFRIQQINKKKISFVKLKEYSQALFEKLKGEFMVIIPNNRLKVCYNLLIFVFTMLEFIYIPLVACFEISEKSHWYQSWRKYFYGCFLFDIFLNFNTGYFNKGTLIKERHAIIKKYMKFRFWIDLCTILPNFLAAISAYFDKSLRFYEFFFLVRIFFLNEMIRKICDFYNSGEFINSIIGLIKLCILTLYVAHICACLWHYISLVDSQHYHVTWLTVFLQTEEDTSVTNEYITSLYWAVTTMITVGYGDIVPKTPNEKMFAITSMLLACCVFAYIMNSIGLVINSFNNRQAILRHKIQAVNKYLDMKHIDDDLRVRIRKYLEYLYEEKNALVREGQTVVANLSFALKTEIFQRLNGEIIVKIPILIRSFTPKLLTQMTLLMKEVSYTPEDLIFSENDIGNQELFFIYEGEVEIFIENFSGFKEDTFLKKLEKEDYFGEIAFFSNQARSASAKSLGFTNLISIAREDFLGVIRNFSFDYEKYCMINDNIRLYKYYYNISVKCFCCNINNHLSIECPMVHIVMNRDRIIRDYIYSEPNERFPYIRRKKPKFHVLCNMQKLITATLKIHRTTTFELYIYPDEENDEEDDNEDEEERSIKYQRGSKYISRHNSNKVNINKHMVSIGAPYRKSRSYTRNFNNEINSNSIQKFNTNSVIVEERDEERKGIIRSKETVPTEIKLFGPDYNTHTASNRTSLFSPNTITNIPNNTNAMTYVSLGANVSLIEKRQETYLISEAGNYFNETLSPSKTNSYMEGISQNELANENLSEDLESYMSSLVPEKTKASKKSELFFSTILSQNPKSNSNYGQIGNTQIGNTQIGNTQIGNTQIGNTLIVNNMSASRTTNKKEEKKKDANLNNIHNTTFFLQNNYFQLVSKAREDFENNFEKMKIFDVYFPHNNVSIIIEDNRKAKIRNRKSLKNGRSINSHSSPNNKNLSTLIKNIPIFKKKIGGGTINEDNRLASQGDGNFRRRRLSDASFLERSKTLKSSKTLKNNASKLKCKFWLCSCCKKNKGKEIDLKKKMTLQDRRVSVAERLRRASIYG